MAHTKILFQKVNNKISRYVFENVNKRYFSSKSSRTFTHRNHFTFLVYCILTQVKSLREGIDNFQSLENKLYYLGFSATPKLSTVSEANSKRTYKFYEELFSILLSDTHKKIKNKIKPIIKIMDSSIITVNHPKAEWAKYNSKINGIKIHVILDYEKNLPVSADVTTGNIGDITIAKEKKFNKGDYFIGDRAYFKAKWLYKQHENGVKFIIRLKKNIIYSTLSTKVLADGNVREESKIQFIGDTSQEYSENLRKITIFDKRKNETFDIITNDFETDVLELANMYKKRWAIELFFKWIKQNLKIKKFIGYSENAIKLHIWIAMITYLIIWQINQESKNQFTSMTKLLRYFKVRLFQPDLGSNYYKIIDKYKKPPNQILLFEENST